MEFVFDAVLLCPPATRSLDPHLAAAWAQRDARPSSPPRGSPTPRGGSPGASQLSSSLGKRTREQAGDAASPPPSQAPRAESALEPEAVEALERLAGSLRAASDGEDADGLQLLIRCCSGDAARAEAALATLAPAALPEEGLLCAVRAFASADCSAQATAAFASGALLPRLCALEQPASRALFAGVLALQEEQPKTARASPSRARARGQPASRRATAAPARRWWMRCCCRSRSSTSPASARRRARRPRRHRSHAAPWPKREPRRARRCSGG